MPTAKRLEEEDSMGNLVVEYYLIKVTIKCKGGALFTTATASAVLIRLQKVTKPKLNSYQINCYCYDCDCCDCDCDRGGGNRFKP